MHIVCCCCCCCVWGFISNNNYSSIIVQCTTRIFNNVCATNKKKTFCSVVFCVRVFVCLRSHRICAGISCVHMYVISQSCGNGTGLMLLASCMRSRMHSQITECRFALDGFNRNPIMQTCWRRRYLSLRPHNCVSFHRCTFLHKHTDTHALTIKHSA